MAYAIPEAPAGLVDLIPKDVSAGPSRPAEITCDELRGYPEIALQSVCPNRVDLKRSVIDRPVLIKALQWLAAAALGQPYSD